MTFVLLRLGQLEAPNKLANKRLAFVNTWQTYLLNYFSYLAESTFFCAVTNANPASS